MLLILWKTVSCLLLSGLPDLAMADLSLSTSQEFRLADGSPGSTVTVLEKNVCTRIRTLQGVRSSAECAYRCSYVGCVGMAFKDEVCRMAWVETSMYLLAHSVCSEFNTTDDEAAFIWTDWKSQLNYTSTVYKNTSTGASGTVQSLTVNQTGCYRMEAFGARGGRTNPAFSPVYTGGFGAYIGGNFNLTAGTQISIVIGQRGADANQALNTAASGGGGGTFVYRSSDNLLYLAAGGGGGGSLGFNGVNGSAGVNGTDTVGTASYVGFGGANGQPGSYGPSTSSYKGGLGAGWLGAAVSRASTCYGDRGGSLVQGWVGGVAGHGNEGAVGGFGGGGGGSHQSGAAGGGGGFSGCGAGSWSPQAGGGGGSFCSGLDCSAVSGGNSYSDGGLLFLRLMYTGSCV